MSKAPMFNWLALAPALWPDLLSDPRPLAQAVDPGGWPRPLAQVFDPGFFAQARGPGTWPRAWPRPLVQAL